MRLTRILPETDDQPDNFILLAKSLEDRARASARGELDEPDVAVELTVDFWMAA